MYNVVLIFGDLVIQLYIYIYICYTYIYIFFFILFSIVVYYKILDIVPCAIPWDLVVYLFCM